MTTGYPVLATRGGRGAWFGPSIPRRSTATGTGRATAGRSREKAVGVWDEWLPDGGQKRVFRPLWVRTWRYLELQIEAGEEPLTIEDVPQRFVRLSGRRKARFASDRPVLNDIWEAGWRTLHSARRIRS